MRFRGEGLFPNENILVVSPLLGLVLKRLLISLVHKATAGMMIYAWSQGLT